MQPRVYTRVSPSVCWLIGHSVSWSIGNNLAQYYRFFFFLPLIFFMQMIKREMTLFETSVQRERPPALERLYSALTTLPPTSVEAERAFSSAGLFITKIRSRLSDKSIDCLCFLRKLLLTK